MQPRQQRLVHVGYNRKGRLVHLDLQPLLVHLGNIHNRLLRLVTLLDSAPHQTDLVGSIDLRHGLRGEVW